MASLSTIWLQKRLFLNLLVVFLDTVKPNVNPKANNDQADEQMISTFSEGWGPVGVVLVSACWFVYFSAEGAGDSFCIPSFGQCPWPRRGLSCGDMLVKQLLRPFENWHLC